MNGRAAAAGIPRLRQLTPDGLVPAQRALYDSLVAHEVPWAENAGATVGAAWRTGYEIYAHTPFAHAAGLSDTTIEAIVSDRHPDFESAKEASAYGFTRQLVTRQQVDDATYARAAAEFGDTGLVEMVLLTGLYLSVCAIINAFDIGVPERGKIDDLPQHADDLQAGCGAGEAAGGAGEPA